MNLTKEEFMNLKEISYISCQECDELIETVPFFEDDYGDYICMECYDKGYDVFVREEREQC